MTSATTVGKRIQRLRVANGWSQADFATACGIATGTLSMVENGRQAADLDMLDAMAPVLGCTTAYLTRVQRDMVGTQPWLRAYADASKRAVDRYVADSETAVEAIEHLGLKSLPDVIPTFDGDLNDDHAIEQYAGYVREAARLTEGDVVGNAMRAAERLGCVILPMDDELGRHMGMSMRINALPVIRVSRPYAAELGPDGTPLVLPSGDRQRFTVAHEIGHLGLHAACAPPTTADEGTRYERQAHRFAGAFLTPAEPLLQDLRELGGRVTLTTLQGLKARWGVAIKMLVVRLRQLDHIEEDQARSLYKQISARRWNKAEPIAVDHERAIWLQKSFSRVIGDSVDLAALTPRDGLSSNYHHQWIDWSTRQTPDDPTGSVVQLPTRPRTTRPKNSGQFGRVHQLRR